MSISETGENEGRGPRNARRIVPYVILLIKQVAIPEENHSLPIGRHMRNHEGRPAAEG